MKRLKSILITAILIFTFSMEAFAKSADTSGGFKFWYVIIIALIAFAVYMVYAWNVNNKVSIKEEEVHIALSEISKQDASWDEQFLKNKVQEVFYKFQRALAEGKSNEIKKLIHPDLYARWKEQIESIKGKNIEELKNKGVEDVEIADVKNYKQNEKDTFTASIDILESEYTVDKKGNLILENEENEMDVQGMLMEYWTFEKEKEDWVLIDISRDSKWKNFINHHIVDEENIISESEENIN